MRTTIFSLCLLAILASCNKDEVKKIDPPASSGNTMTLNGLIGSEQGSSAGNSVFVDFSADKQSPVARASWDLGFYCGEDFKVILNNTLPATAHVINKTDIKAVGKADTVGLQFAMGYNPADTSLADNVEDFRKRTLIPAISATADDNKVIVIHRGTDVSSAKPRDFIKIKILRKGTSGYTLQYAKLEETDFKTIDIEKDSKYNFKYTSFDKGLLNVEPEKSEWDIVWGVALYKAAMGAETIPYTFSDMVAINYLGGTTAFERVYANENEGIAAFDKFNKDSVAKYTFKSEKWVIGSNWRLTIASLSGEPAGIRKNRFYVIKDAAGNVYKLRFLAAGLGKAGNTDGGTRGKPEIKYEIIK